MASRKNKARKPSAPVNEVAGILLLGLGTLLFLALVSYDPGDLPGWVWFSHVTPQNDPLHNFIGIVGALVAGVLYFLIGAASYLLAVVLLGYGAGKLLNISLRVGARFWWIALFLLSGACLLAIQKFALQSWHTEFNIQGPGGWVGHLVGDQLLGQVLGPVGSQVLLLAVYFSSLVLMTGIRPVQFVRQVRQAGVRLIEAIEEHRRSKADVAEQLAIEQKRIERERKRIERELRKQKVGKGRGEPDGGPAGAEGGRPGDRESPLPEPRIIDANAPAAPTQKAPAKNTPALDVRENTTFDNYELPSLDLLNSIDLENRLAANHDELLGVQRTIIDTLDQFGITVSAGDITRGPSITRYEVYPDKGVRVDKIVNLERDIARATRAERINILAPIPGKDTVGIEIANSKKVTVTLRELLESPDWSSTNAQIPFALGKDVYGRTIIADLAKMPHCLVAGTTGSGKSVCINSMVASMLFRFSPDDLRMIMIDPKVVELQIYNKLPHLVVPVVTDPKKVLLALRWVIDEMEKRYKVFAKVGVRNILGYNALQKDKKKESRPADGGGEKDKAVFVSQAGKSADCEAEDVPPEPPVIRVPRDEDAPLPDHMPYIVVIVDELADLMQTAPADVESAIARITQMARAAGIHMIIATQTPRADVITGVIKANVPSRIAFQVASKLDSRVILDENGAERLLGQGDMLYLPPGTSRLVRAQGVFVTDEEIAALVDFVSSDHEPAFEQEIHSKLESDLQPEEEITPEDEELCRKAIEILRQEKIASTSRIQRRLRLGYTRAARIVDILEQRGVVGPGEGAKPREILVDLDTYTFGG